jgi:hypothetical protein
MSEDTEPNGIEQPEHVDHDPQLPHGLHDELRFLAAWEDRRVPWLGAYLRVRQLRRANVSLAGSIEIGDFRR